MQETTRKCFRLGEEVCKDCKRLGYRSYTTIKISALYSKRRIFLCDYDISNFYETKRTIDSMGMQVTVRGNGSILPPETMLVSLLH